MPQKPYIILGLGKTGLSCIKFLTQQKQDFIVLDSREEPPELAYCKEQFPGCQIHLGKFEQKILSTADTIIISPGLSIDTPEINKCRENGVEIISDIELFARHCKAPVIAITGTNGKSTVTTLTGELLKSAGYKVKVGGNLGVPALDLIGDDEPDYYVLELSSFQLETTYSLKAKVATILNISPDHLDRHGDLASYIKCKHRIYLNSENIVYNSDDPNTKPGTLSNCSSFALNSPKINEFGITEYNGENYLAYSNELLIPTANLKIPGKHNWQNALASLAIINSCKIPLEKVYNCLQNFSGLEHRCQWVRKISDINWYNDSKGTNVGACSAAIEGLGETISGKVVLLAGGQGKGATFIELQNPVRKYTSHVILYGEDATLIGSALKDQTKIHYVSDLEQAIILAKKLAIAGDAVLLSPACASFDSFENFAERGEVYMKLVKGLN